MPTNPTAPKFNFTIIGILIFIIIVRLLPHVTNPNKTLPTTTPQPSNPTATSPTPTFILPPHPSSITSTNNQPLYLVTKIVDGDTIIIARNSQTETVRLVGINTPETVDPRTGAECFGREASAQMSLLALNRQVYLEPDPTQSDRDRYNRLLRFVFLEDGTDIGLSLIKQGFAHQTLYSAKPHKYHPQYLQAEQFAITQQLGLWNPSACTQPTIILPPYPSKVQGVSITYTGDYTCDGPDRDCSDFPTHEQAQAFFIQCGGPSQDPHRLDIEQDGLACETLP